MSTHDVGYHAFPLAGVDAMSADTDRSFPRHTHDQFGIGVIDRGGHVSWSGRGEVEAAAGCLISVNPGEVHDGRPLARRKRAWRMLYLEPALVRDSYADIGEGKPLEFVSAYPVFVDRMVRRSFDELFALAKKATPGVNVACETRLLALLAELQAYGASGSVPRTLRAAPAVDRALARIDADPGHAVTLAELARDAGLTRYQLILGFARRTGLTPHAYILQQRLHLARRLLGARIDLADVAQRCGFYDQSHLTRCFTRQFGAPPGRYASRPC